MRLLEASLWMKTARLSYCTASELLCCSQCTKHVYVTLNILLYSCTSHQVLLPQERQRRPNRLQVRQGMNPLGVQLTSEISDTECWHCRNSNSMCAGFGARGEASRGLRCCSKAHCGRRLEGLQWHHYGLRPGTPPLYITLSPYNSTTILILREMASQGMQTC